MDNKISFHSIQICNSRVNIILQITLQTEGRTDKVSCRVAFIPNSGYISTYDLNLSFFILFQKKSGKNCVKIFIQFSFLVLAVRKEGDIGLLNKLVSEVLL